MRPPTRRTPVNILPCHIAILPNCAADDLPMPEPKQILIDRDVDLHDWMTFVNHLIPYQTTNPSGNDPAKTIDKKGRAGHTPSINSFSPPFPELKRQKAVRAVVEEWNQGFFRPRGFEVVVQVDVTPRLHRPTPADVSGPSNTSHRPQRNAHNLSPQTVRPVAILPQRKSKAKRKNDKELGIALYHAVRKRDESMCEVLLEAGADPNAKPLCENPSIVEAVKQGELKILEMLLEHGPDLNASATGGGTALYYAVSKNKSDMVKLLLKHGADVNKRPTGEDAPLYKAVNKQYDEIAELLLQTKLKIDDAPPGGVTPMYVTAKKGNVALVERLLAAGAKPDARPAGNDTAFFEAAKKGHYEICRILLKYGADVDARTTGNNTALWNLVGKGDENLVRLLLENGANINARTCGGDSVLEKAVKKGRKDIVELLLQYATKS
ncbi:MAG: hypothetical protein Q9170_005006 [Blastenia crenularia]